jgi:N-acyl-L-homoserine lactone synthetase
MPKGFQTMLFIRHEDLEAHARVSSQMFRDRARQFKVRLGWDVHVTADGVEVDDYDAPPAVYAIASDQGRHVGSVRLKPTTGPTMINDHFGDLAGRPLMSKGLAEVTRFCLAPDAPKGTAAALMLATNAWGAACDLEGVLAVFDFRMERIYRLLGHAPEVLGSRGEGRARVSAGIWRRDPMAVLMLERASGLKFHDLKSAALATAKGTPHHEPQV